MSLSALNSIDDAIEATKRFLVPFDRARWFRLAVVMFFVSGAGGSFTNVPGGFNPTGFGGPSGPTEPGAEPGPGTGPDPGALTPEITPELVVFLVALVLFGVALAVLWAIAGAVMEFVFVQSLSREDVRLWGYFTGNWWRGVRLFAFRAGVWLLTGAVVGGLLLALGLALGGWPVTGWTPEIVVGLGLLALPIGLLWVVVVGTTLGFTTMFVVPVMLTEDRGVIAGWRRFWPTLTAAWKEYLVYLVISILLGFVIGIAAGFLGLLAFVVLAIPFAVVGIPLVLVFGIQGLGGVVVLVLVFMFVVVFVLAMLLIRVPFETFLRYYALLVLGDTNADFDVIPDARAAVRADGGTDGDAGDGSGSGGGDDSGGPGDDPDGVDADPDEDGDDSWNVDRDGRL